MNENTAKAPLQKSAGVTATERLLADFCERSFLKLWSYPNPYKDDGHELCDLLAVFDDYVFIFFDREKALPVVPDKDQQVLWDRWKRNVIDRQVKTAHGAERYIRGGRPIFLDGKMTTPFPLAIDPEKAVIHKIVVAHGAKEACEQASSQNIYGSLAITYSESDGGPTPPFHIEIDKRTPVHILDSHNMPIVLAELDTVSDFAAYLDAKAIAIARFDCLSYCGEEDLLGHYYLNYDNASKRYGIGPKDNDNATGVMIGEGEWHDFIKTSVYENTKKKDQISYFWDALIQRTCQNAINGTLSGNSNILRGESAIHEMVREPRFYRRNLARKMLDAVERFPDRPSQFTRQVTFVPSYLPNVGYVLFQLRAPDAYRAEPDYRAKRQTLLQVACGAAKNKFPNLVKVIGIGIDAPRFAGGTNAEDFILMPCEVWTDEMRKYYEAENEDFKFFQTPQLQQFTQRVTQFVPLPDIASSTDHAGKVGRNEPCPCGSGRKFKKCHGS